MNSIPVNLFFSRVSICPFRCALESGTLIVTTEPSCTLDISLKPLAVWRDNDRLRNICGPAWSIRRTGATIGDNLTANQPYLVRSRWSVRPRATFGEAVVQIFRFRVRRDGRWLPHDSNDFGLCHSKVNSVDLGRWRLASEQEKSEQEGSVFHGLLLEDSRSESNARLGFSFAAAGIA